MLRAVAILKDQDDKTVGLSYLENGMLKEITTNELKVTKGIIQFENAIVDKNGFIKKKRGYNNLDIITVNSKPTVMQSIERKEVSKIKNSEVLKLYHGNKDKDMIPNYGKGKKKNDYGVGLYMTLDKELGMEWAMSPYTTGDIGWLHEYTIDIMGLKILDLTKLDTLHWIAELMTYRTINIDETNEVVIDNINRLKKRYKLDTSIYDIIIGYRADDTYFSYTTAFVSGTMYRDTLEKAIRLGGLGIQVFIKSELSFSKLDKVDVTPVNQKCKERYITRDAWAKKQFDKVRNENRIAGVKELIYKFI